MKKNRQESRKSGFTMVEIMLVVCIIGILAVIMLPAVLKARNKSLRTAFINDLRVFSNAAEYYMLSTSQYLENAEPGVVPNGFADFIKANKWTDGTPIRGSWDSELDTFGIKAGIGVQFADADNPGDAYMRQIDKEFDDGNLLTGSFRKLDNNRYYYVLEA